MCFVLIIVYDVKVILYIFFIGKNVMVLVLFIYRLVILFKEFYEDEDEVDNDGELFYEMVNVFV